MTNPRIIILEGIDKAGKSTAAERIMKEFPEYKLLKGLSSKNITDFRVDSDKLASEIHEALNEHPGVIVDRIHLLSDPIYNPIIGSEEKKHQSAILDYVEQYNKLEECYAELNKQFGSLLFLFTADQNVILNRMQDMGGPEDELEEKVRKNTAHYLKGYDSLYASYATGSEVMQNLFTNVVLVDTSNIGPEQVGDAITAILKNDSKIPNTTTIQKYIKKASNYGERKTPLMVAAITPRVYNTKGLGKLNLVLSQNIDTLRDAKVWMDCNEYKILDNGAFELGESQLFADVLRKGVDICANEVVLPDKFRDGNTTIKMVRKGLQTFRKLKKHQIIPTDKRFKFMAVPQGETLQEWMDSYKKLGNMTKVHVIAINRDSAKFFGSRLELLDFLDRSRMIFPDKEYHLLGMQDHIGELLGVQENYPWVRSIDSCFPYLIARDVANGSLESVEKVFEDNIHRKEFKSTIDFESHTTDKELKVFEEVKDRIRSWGIII